MKFQPHERIFCEIFALGNIGEMGLHHTKLEEMARSAVIPTIDNGKIKRSRRHEQPIPPPMKNERPNAQRDFLKRKRSKPEHQAPKHHVEVGIKNLHRIQAAYIPVNRGSQSAPPQRITPRGQERCWRGIGDRNPLSLSNRPREEQIKSTHTMWYSPLVKPKRKPKAKRSFLRIAACAPCLPQTAAPRI